MSRIYISAIALTFSSSLWAEQNLNQNQKPKVSDYQAVQVKNTLKKKSKDLQTCWLDYLKVKSHKERGRITIDWRVNGKGLPEKVEYVDGDFDNEAFAKCLVNKIKSYEFPPPGEGKTEYIAHDFSFITEEEAKKTKDQAPFEIKKSGT